MAQAGTEPLELFADGSCRGARGTPAAGFGVWAEGPSFRVRVAEPLPGPRQSAQRAEVRALLAALELALALMAPEAVVFMDSAYAVKAYGAWMGAWRRNAWRKADGAPVAHQDLWILIEQFPARLVARGLDVRVVWRDRNSRHGMVMADGMAKLGADSHIPCKNCGASNGRTLVDHICAPTATRAPTPARAAARAPARDREYPEPLTLVCDVGACEAREFATARAMIAHTADCHTGSFTCRLRRCTATLGSLKSRRKHELMAHDGMVFYCRYCSVRFLSPARVRAHQSSSCPNSPICTECKAKFDDVQQRDIHMREEHIVACDWCCQEFSSRQERAQHMADDNCGVGVSSSDYSDDF